MNNFLFVALVERYWQKDGIACYADKSSIDVARLASALSDGQAA